LLLAESPFLSGVPGSREPVFAGNLQALTFHPSTPISSALSLEIHYDVNVAKLAMLLSITLQVDMPCGDPAGDCTIWSN
jgi:hypothetical protein